jgi:hypothetical protein
MEQSTLPLLQRLCQVFLVPDSISLSQEDNNMKHQRILTFLSAIGMVAAIGITTVNAADQPIYGSQLMTEQERAEHRAKMQSFQTEQEREAYRQQHHQMMQQRARAQGITLPDQPMPRGQGRGMGPGMGQGQGMGPGMGQGRGMGPGMGQGQGMGQGRGMGPGMGQGQGQTQQQGTQSQQ